MHISRISPLNLILVGLLAAIGCQDGDRTERLGRLLPASVVRQPPFEFTGKFVAIYSGDSFEVLDSGGNVHSIRLIGVDCPEPNQEKFREARRLVEQAIRGIELHISIIKRDEYMIDHCEVTAGETNVGLSLVRCGLAWYNGDQFAGCEAYAAAQAEAKKETIEIWSQNNPIPPWESYNKYVQQKQDKAADGMKKSGK